VEEVLIAHCEKSLWVLLYFLCLSYMAELMAAVGGMQLVVAEYLVQSEARRLSRRRERSDGSRGGVR
jgi:hypothetical protein